ncbi:MAG TPA: asparagine synthase (glutamine-hydrolyzing), partial [Steroidobacteraceae bacterium]|nr:asparagine synthase (glutamine-hydrolyzing) [Steroidobacteraceae bacterium]
MCGIGGYVDPRGILDGSRVLSRLAAALAHRGPDGEGFFTAGGFGLAHRRLAIIDLSEGAAQPMRVGPITVVYNGEIYNYRELRDELRAAGQTFTGASDTEVLARAYLQWGATFARRLRGMWAFAIFDERTYSLVCARDPFGIKPFYHCRKQGAFLFASEPQALLRAGMSPHANLATAAQYLAFGLSDLGRDSFFRYIQQLNAGETIVVDAQGVLSVIDTLDACTVPPGSATAAEFAQCLEESIRLHLRSDVPVGTCLSGGLDSSTVAALASAAVRANGGPRFAAVTAASGDPRTDEREYAAAVAKHCDLDWHLIAPSSTEFVAEIDDCLRAQGEPALSPSVYLQYRVMREARAAGLKVMLDGQGADELLCGYERYAPLWAMSVKRESGTLKALGEFTRVARNTRPGLGGMVKLAAYVLSPSLRRRVIGARTNFLRAEFSAGILEVVSRITRASQELRSARAADIRDFSLPALLRFEDRNSMAHSIEARVPYVDKGVASCALRIADRQLLQQGFTKYPLRTVAARVLPASIAWRGSKVGFEPPSERWLGALRERMQQQVNSSTLLLRLCRQVRPLHALPLAMQW